MSPERREEVIAVCNSERFRDSTPHEIVPMLLDEDRYIASVRTMYRVLKEESEKHSKDLFENLSRGRNIRFESLHADNGSPMKGTTLIAF